MHTNIQYHLRPDALIGDSRELEGGKQTGRQEGKKAGDREGEKGGSKTGRDNL